MAIFDSNFGDEPLEAGFRRWTWSRARTRGGAAILYDAERSARGRWLWALSLTVPAVSGRSRRLPWSPCPARAGASKERHARNTAAPASSTDSKIRRSIHARWSNTHCSANGFLRCTKVSISTVLQTRWCEQCFRSACHVFKRLRDQAPLLGWESRCDSFSRFLYALSTGYN